MFDKIYILSIFWDGNGIRFIYNLNKEVRDGKLVTNELHLTMGGNAELLKAHKIFKAVIRKSLRNNNNSKKRRNKICRETEEEST